MLTRNIFFCKCGKTLRSTNLVKNEELAKKLENLKIKCPNCGGMMSLEVQKFAPPYWTISSFKSDTQSPLWLTFLNSEILGLWPDHIQVDIHKLLESGFGGDLEVIAEETCYRITFDPLNYSFTEGKKKVRLESDTHLRPRMPESQSPQLIEVSTDETSSERIIPHFEFMRTTGPIHPDLTTSSEPGLIGPRRRTRSEH